MQASGAQTLSPKSLRNALYANFKKGVDVTVSFVHNGAEVSTSVPDNVLSRFVDVLSINMSEDGIGEKLINALPLDITALRIHDSYVTPCTYALEVVGNPSTNPDPNFQWVRVPMRSGLHIDALYAILGLEKPNLQLKCHVKSMKSLSYNGPFQNSATLNIHDLSCEQQVQLLTALAKITKLPDTAVSSIEVNITGDNLFGANASIEDYGYSVKYNNGPPQYRTATAHVLDFLNVVKSFKPSWSEQGGSKKKQPRNARGNAKPSRASKKFVSTGRKDRLTGKALYICEGSQVTYLRKRKPDGTYGYVRARTASKKI